MKFTCCLLLFCLATSLQAETLRSGDATIRSDGAQWILGTDAVEKTVTLEEGRFLLKSFRHKAANLDLIPPGTVSGEFSFTLGNSPDPISGASGGWRLAGSQMVKLKQGELQLDITLEREGLQVTKTYVIYPKSSVIREWVTFKNTGAAALRVNEPDFLNVTARLDAPRDLDFHWMTGGASYPGSWTLKTESLADQPRRFDSYDAFPADPRVVADSVVDGVNVKILRNGAKLWPEGEWQWLLDPMANPKFDVATEVKAGDRLEFLVNMNKNFTGDTTAFDLTITYADGESHTASREFSAEQGKNGWRYQYIENGQHIDLVYYPKHEQWRKKVDNPSGTPFIAKATQHPGDQGVNVTRIWTAPKAGKIRLTSPLSFRPGSSSYAPWYALAGRKSQAGLVIGLDYFGHWASFFEPGRHGAVTARLQVAGHRQTLAPGQSFSTPKAFVALYRGDLDEAGNELLNWQYRYLWDYAREGWFPAIRMLGYWMKGTSWGKDFRGNRDFVSPVRKVFRTADLMRATGADVYHRDWGWWDKAGDWNGPDWRAVNQYLAKNDMGMLIYSIIYALERDSKIGREHPDWIIDGTELVDMSRLEAAKMIKQTLDSFVGRWGRFMWRTDGFLTSPVKGDDTPILGQDQAFRDIIQTFLDRHPDCAFQACNGGGNYLGYDYVRYASCIQMTDGGAGLHSNYHNTLLIPPDKMCHMPDSWDPDKYDKSTWRGLLSLCFDMTGDTIDPNKVEGVRQLIDIYHYLCAQGVVGRWVKVYRPIITGDDPTMYFERLSGDRKRGVIITKHAAPGPVTIRPKGLLPEAKYFVSFQESAATQTRTGAELMAEGFKFELLPPGELIYLNLPLHPGSRLDTKPPKAPHRVEKRAGENLGFPGVEISWQAGTDDNWVSCYEVRRDGAFLDKVAKGTYYFDHSAGADPAARYEVCTVDGAGNASAAALARGPEAAPTRIIDDAAGEGMNFTGFWERRLGESPAHHGTIARAKEKGSAVEVPFEGRKALLFAKLGPDCGKAEVSIDGGPAEVIDTYSADDIWGACVYRKELPGGRHTLRLTVQGERGPNTQDTWIQIDGLRAEP